VITLYEQKRKIQLIRYEDAINHNHSDYEAIPYD